MLNKTLKLATVSIVALTASASLASAQTASATASSDLNLRSGPGPQYQIQGVMMAGDSVTVDGCLASQEWCRVTSGGGEGWAYAPYLMFDAQGEAKPLNQVASTTVTVIEDTSERDDATLIGTGMGAVAGALIAGPVGAVAGGMLTGIAANASVDSEVTYYVQENPVQPVFLSGEPVVGASIPADVTIYDVPSNEQVAYLNVNGDAVVVERESRRIIEVVR
ncbi:SH3 domain-containing protein [Pararhodobacter sp. CCB-MM2]|uniref:SH3 domain-containing protein n=1 Tax=Pararhodobacter sp. CCB-MM2 TaxID=1786003 RepID=UPI00083176D6|nr:SH3 domain-containing protein [Pararhodobacter sp. CCB-MM2]MCA2012928.1 SH3 domain-containing protein [Cereibacter sphaeroides]